MRPTSSLAWPVPWAFYLIQFAWIVTALYFLVSVLQTNRIKRRETGGARLLDRVLLLGGYVLLFAEMPLLGTQNLHFVAPTKNMQIAGAALTYLGLSLRTCERIMPGRGNPELRGTQFVAN